ncbi:MAG: alpha-hydroxy-acid oxidizing protein [Ignavibacteria bacterium]|nr:alpha-hydroxy-acid oxidizing protein [Ignavibacteria bacterium]
MNSNPITISDIEIIAKEKLHPHAFDYYSSGADDEITLKENCNAFNKIFLKYRVLVDVSKRDMSATVLGHKTSVPFLIAPTAFHKMAYPDGEIATAKAAGKAGTVMILSTLSNSTVEEVTEAASGPVWFQLYVFKDREITRDLIKRAEAACVKAIVITVDAPLLGQRVRDVKNKFDLPSGLTVKNLEKYFKEDLIVNKNDSGLASYVKENLDASLNWKDISWIRSVTKLPLILKGIACREDAILAAEHNVEGIVVSNHGGRQLDTCRATIDVLPEVADAVKGKTEIYLDGGIRRGTDILKSIALGADAVLIGRPVIWGLAYNGENGVTDALNILRKELDLAMALCGCADLKNITKDIIVRN